MNGNLYRITPKYGTVGYSEQRYVIADSYTDAILKVECEYKRWFNQSIGTIKSVELLADSVLV